jgi:hypothetical protein
MPAGPAGCPVWAMALSIGLVATGATGAIGAIVSRVNSFALILFSVY